MPILSSFIAKKIYFSSRLSLNVNICLDFLINFIIKMQNLQLKKVKNKRSIESLIEQSALDDSFNMQAHQLRKAFNETLIAINLKTNETQKELQKTKIMLKEYEQNRIKYEKNMKKMQEECSLKQNQCLEMQEKYKQMKKKYQYLQNKLQNISENRNLFDNNADNEEDNEQLSRKKIKNEIYNELNKIITKKIQYFTKDIKQCSMSREAEQKMQSFLEELIYLNPYSQFHVVEQIKQDKKFEYRGKIKKQHSESITDQNQWKMLQKSLQKLKEINKKRTPLMQKQYMPQKSVSVNKRKRLFQN